jgi:UDP-N-acetylglucosamine 4,6-dehydratase
MQNDKKTYLVSGGTGSLGKHLVKRLLKDGAKKVIVFSRDEHKQVEMEREIEDKRLRFVLGDIRDYNTLHRACSGVGILLHCAALKHVHKCEYNPFEAVKTNILGAQNIIDAAIENGVDKVLAISTDKAVNPINLYGATKLCSDKLFTAADAYSAGRTSFAVMRFGNFECSRGSVIPLFKQQKENGEPLTVTDDRMTRFTITLDAAVEKVMQALQLMEGGEVFSPKMPSIKIMDLAKSMSDSIEIVGMRQGEKLHEDLIITEDAPKTYELDNFFITTQIYRGKGKKVPLNFSYSSDNNLEWVKSL